jgi:hypothetical protein
MIRVVLAALGLPLWLVIGALGAHQALLVHRGLALVRTDALPVANVTGRRSDVT